MIVFGHDIHQSWLFVIFTLRISQAGYLDKVFQWIAKTAAQLAIVTVCIKVQPELVRSAFKG